MNTTSKNFLLGRATIGLILPSVDLITTSECRAVFPKDINIIETRIMLQQTTPDSLMKSTDQVLNAATLLASAKPDVISYHCTAGAFIRGHEYEKKYY